MKKLADMDEGKKSAGGGGEGGTLGSWALLAGLMKTRFISRGCACVPRLLCARCSLLLLLLLPPPPLAWL